MAARGCYDLAQHQAASGKSLELFDEARGVRELPQVVEPSIGVDRLFLAVLCSAYATDVVQGEPRTVLRCATASRACLHAHCATTPQVRAGTCAREVRGPSAVQEEPGATPRCAGPLR